MRGISPVIAELIIVVLAVSISIAVIGYVMGWFNLFSSSTEGIYLYPDSELIVDTKNNTVYGILHLKTNYKPSITITKIYLKNVDASSIELIEIIQGGPVTINGTEVLVPDGTECILKIEFPISPSDVKPDIPGKKEVYVMTNSGNLYKTYLEIVYK
ncbi:MAG: hypothetical protein F7C36_07540 [Desulfurococcales archaeon]|nr:hypothetical protein [Desulfurococcales archaeon]